MSSLSRKKMMHLKRKRRVRKKVIGIPGKPRLNVFKSSRHIYAQIIDDSEGKTLLAYSTLNKDFDKKGLKGKLAVAKRIGEILAEKAITKGINKVVFDRNGFLYHGRVKALADGAREKGLIC
ncbi:MAG: 50S ribosomal protein L18 [Thermodesulfobacteriota bacterium]